MGLGLGLTCGAVNGALMVLGLAAGPASEDDRQARFLSYDRGAEFARRFADRHGSLACRDLMGADMTTLEGRQQARDQGQFARICPEVVRSAAEILQDMLSAREPGGEGR